jgi:MinD-like ATPase involved in chromosome partitioning or flagellar assembly
MLPNPGRIITFYSYKGGVGRSMNLMNVAWIIASSGMRVLLVDWDLEAPGLNRYLGPFLKDPELSSTSGLLDMLTDFVFESMTPAKDSQPDWYLSCADLSKHAIQIDWEFPYGGRLDLLCAGKQGPSYVSTLLSFDWTAFYERFSGGAFLEAVKEEMRAEYDYVLIDSRTGITDSSGICTVQMPDDLVVCLAMNSRSVEGASRVATAAAAQRSGSRPLRVFPVPARVELVESDLREQALESAKRQFRLLTPHIQDVGMYYREVSVPYVPFFSFNEIPAPFAGPEATTILEPAVRLASYLTDGKVTHHDPIPDEERWAMMQKYRKQELAG